MTPNKRLLSITVWRLFSFDLELIPKDVPLKSFFAVQHSKGYVTVGIGRLTAMLDRESF